MLVNGTTLNVKKDLMGALYEPMGIVISSLNCYSTGLLL